MNKDKFAKKIIKGVTDDILSDVKEVLAEIDIEGQINHYLDGEQIKDVIKRRIEDEIATSIADEVSLRIKILCRQRVGQDSGFFEQEIMGIMAEKYGL